MKNQNLLKRLRSSMLILCLISLASFYKETTKTEYTSYSLTTEEGIAIHPKIEGNEYGSPIEGEYLVRAPSGKYISVGNVRGNIFIIGGIVIITYILTVIPEKEPTKK